MLLSVTIAIFSSSDMEQNYPDLWEILKQEAEILFNAFPMIPCFSPKEPPTLQNGEIDEIALGREIKMIILENRSKSPEDQQFASSIFRKKYGLIPVKQKPIGAKPLRELAPGRSRATRARRRGRRLL
ncbi:hypothetical protein OROMI_011680 [Orobanche minor]